MCRHKHESLSYDSSLNPHVDGGDCHKRLEAGGNTLPTHHQAAIFLLEPGKRPLGLESGHHFFDRLAPVVYFYPAGNCVASTSGTIPSLHHLCEGALPWYPISFFTSWCWSLWCGCASCSIGRGHATPPSRARQHWILHPHCP